MTHDSLWPDHAGITHAANQTRRQFVAGDIHGCFPSVEQALASLSLDTERDRFFAVGDLIDRGPDSAAALEWLTSQRILAVRGNHEQLMVNNLVVENAQAMLSRDGDEWIAGGGGWFWGHDNDEDGDFVLHDVDHRGRRDEWLAALHGVPFLCTIETERGRVGIAHTLGEWYESWTDVETSPPSTGRAHSGTRTRSARRRRPTHCGRDRASRA